MTTPHDAPRALGVSAHCIVEHMMGAAPSGNYPRDASDFHRCEAVFDQRPEWRSRLPEMAAINAYWAALAPRWAEIQIAEDKSALIASIVRPIEDADPGCVRLSDATTLRTGSRITFNGAKAAPSAQGRPDGQAPSKPKAKGIPMKETKEDVAVRENVYGIAAEELRQFIERYERLEAEKKDITEQQKEVMAEAKGRGYDTKAMRTIISLRKQDPDDVTEQEAILDIYKAALGMS